MKKKILLFAAMFMVIMGMAFVPARTAQAKKAKSSVPNGKYYAMQYNTKVKINGNKVRIKGYLNGYGDQKDAGKVNKTFRLTKGAKFYYGDEVNELITSHKITKKAFIRRLKKDYSCVNINFKNGKITKMKVVYD